MDSLTQAVLGAGIAGAIAPQGQRRKALLLGAALGTLPDLDVLIDYGDAVSNFTRHRGFSHSLFVLAPLSLLIWLFLRRWWPPVVIAPLRWLAVVALPLITHPLLDAHTAYGTQLFWPLALPPTMWATIFIIDPLYTLPLLTATVYAALRPQRPSANTLLRTAIVLSTAYLGWTWIGQNVVERNALDALNEFEMEDPEIFITPTPFNTLLWRIVVKTDDGYLESFDSLLIDERLVFAAYPSDTASLNAASNIPAVSRLRWFAHDFVKATVVDNELVISDLRMGYEPTYVFNHIAAVRGNPHWNETTPKLVPVSFTDRQRIENALADTWNRLWLRTQD